MAHYAFDELRNKDNFTNDKYVVPNIFNFTQEEINGRRFNADLWKKIIPSWSDGYKNLMEVIAIKEKNK